MTKFSLVFAQSLNLSLILNKCNYRKVASSNMSCLEAHAGFFQIAYEGDFDPFFDKK
jgi:hypothetical protein